MSQGSLSNGIVESNEPLVKSNSQSPTGWGWSPTTIGWSDSPLWRWSGSVSPEQAQRPKSPKSPKSPKLPKTPKSPKSPKTRQRSLSPYDDSGKKEPDKFGRGPRVFIVNGHGSTFPDKRGNPALIDGMPVDIFTSVKFGRSFGKYIYSGDTCSFFNEPYEYFIKRLLRTTTENPDVLSTKDTLRDAIYSSLCATRDEDEVIVKSHCKFRCHHKGLKRKMADMYIMSSGSPLNEAVLCIDPFTGTIEDVHDAFGLRKVDNRLITYPRGRKDINKAFNPPIRKFERELEDLRSQMSMLSQPHLRTAEKMDIARKLREEYDEKHARLDTIKEGLRDAVQAPKYRYKVEYQDKYDVHEGRYSIKLSDIINIAIENGTINPRTDFIVVEACRDFYGKLPSDYDPSKSPGRAGSESDSEGGGVRRAYSRKKYGKNKGKNKNKRKTIRKLKSSKSCKSRKSRKSRKRSNSS